MMQIQVTYF